MSSSLKAFWRFLGELVRAQHRDQLGLRAAALAYTMLASVVPLLTVALVTAGRVQPERAEVVIRAIATIFPFSPTRVQTTLATFAQRTASLGWFAIAFSILVSFNAFYQIEEAINGIWGVPNRRRWQLRLFSFSMVLLSGPVLLVALFSGLYWMSSQQWFLAIALLGRPLPAIFAGVTLACLYRFVPHTNVSWKAAWTGAVVAAISLTAIHLGFQPYYSFAGDLNVIYGSLAIVLFFLLSLYLFWFAILLGAEASWVVGHQPSPPRPEKIEALVNLLVKVEREGSVEVGELGKHLGEDARTLAAKMTEEPPILVRSRATWRLARSANSITLQEIRTRAGIEAMGSTGDSGVFTLATLAKQADDTISTAEDDHPMLDIQPT